MMQIILLRASGIRTKHRPSHSQRSCAGFEYEMLQVVRPRDACFRERIYRVHSEATAGDFDDIRNAAIWRLQSLTFL